MERRQLLQRALAMPLALGSARLMAAPASNAKFLLVFLRGGYDAASLLVPLKNDFYYASRPNISIAQPQIANLASAIMLNTDWALHPAFRESLYPMYRRGELAFVPFAGSDDLSRSHFETQDRIELGQSDNRHDFNSGFLNRLAIELADNNAIAFTDQLPLSMRGSWQIANVSLHSVGRPVLNERQAGLIRTMYANTPLAGAVNEGFEVRTTVAQELIGEMEAANRGAVNAKGFELEARRVGRLLRDRYDLGFIDIGGWDTHVGQGNASGYLASRFEELGRGIAGLADELGARWRDTVVVVVSEFGRTFRENGNRGTDHGHGSVYWVAGGSVHGGRIAGEQVTITAKSLFQNRDLPVLNEVRALLGGVFSGMYGFRQEALARIFPDVAARDLGLV